MRTLLFRVGEPGNPDRTRIVEWRRGDSTRGRGNGRNADGVDYRQGSRFVALVAGLPLYIGGSIAVVILPLNQMNNPTQDLSFGVIFGVTTFLLGVVLLSVGCTGYRRARLAACLLLPPMFLAGMAATPGTRAPWTIILSFLAAGAVMFVLLRGWARRASDAAIAPPDAPSEGA